MGLIFMEFSKIFQFYVLKSFCTLWLDADIALLEDKFWPASSKQKETIDVCPGVPFSSILKWGPKGWAYLAGISLLFFAKGESNEIPETNQWGLRMTDVRLCWSVLLKEKGHLNYSPTRLHATKLITVQVQIHRERLKTCLTSGY